MKRPETPTFFGPIVVFHTGEYPGQTVNAGSECVRQLCIGRAIIFLGHAGYEAGKLRKRKGPDLGKALRSGRDAGPTLGDGVGKELGGPAEVADHIANRPAFTRAIQTPLFRAGVVDIFFEPAGLGRDQFYPFRSRDHDSPRYLSISFLAPWRLARRWCRTAYRRPSLLIDRSRRDSCGRTDRRPSHRRHRGRG